MKLNGEIELNFFNEKNKLIKKLIVKNTIETEGFNTFKQILGNLPDANYPFSLTLDDDDLTNILSNSNSFFSQLGTIPLILPIKIINKTSSLRTNAFSYVVDENNIVTSEIETSGQIYNENNIFFNSLNKPTYINIPSKEQYIYIYDIGDINTNRDIFHHGLRVDMRGTNIKRLMFKIAYWSEEKNELNEIINPIGLGYSLPKPIFPLLNGKPTTRLYTHGYGGYLEDNSIQTYLFDLYPRCIKIPEKIIFYFENLSSADYLAIDNVYNLLAEVFIDKIQFFKHTLPKVGPLYISLHNASGIIYRSKINDVKIIDNSIYYYTTLNYNLAIGSYTKIGLVNSSDNIIEVDDVAVNNEYNSNLQYFKRTTYANKEDCSNQLTIADNVFTKVASQRIDIAYKININF